VENKMWDKDVSGMSCGAEAGSGIKAQRVTG